MQHLEQSLKQQRRYRYILIFMSIFLIITIIGSFYVGFFPLSPKEIVQAFLSKFGYQSDISKNAITIFWSIRLPRILAAVAIGACLSVSGATYQGMFQNPLVSPDILGVSSGASLGAALAILRGSPNWIIQVSAFLGGIIAVSISYTISHRSKYNQIVSMVLTGFMISSLCNAGVTMIKYISNPNDVLPQITFWLMGSLTKVDMPSFFWSAIPMLIGMVIIFILRWRINLLTLNDEEAKSLGINVKKYRLVFIFTSTLLSAAAVCLGGLIGWVGLMVPHLVRYAIGSNYKQLIPACALVGATYLLLVDNIARAFLNLELPIGVVTSLLGAPFFVFLILKKNGR